jgi:hypothetical protein
LPHVALSPLVLPLLSCRCSICDDSSADYTQLHLVDSQHISHCAAVIPPLHRKIFSLQLNHRGVNKGTASSLPIPAISPSPFDLTAPGLQCSGSILWSQFDYFLLLSWVQQFLHVLFRCNVWMSFPLSACSVLKQFPHYANFLLTQ